MYRISGNSLLESSDAIHGEWKPIGRIITRAAIYLGHLLNVYWINLDNDRNFTYVFKQYNDESTTLGRVRFCRKISFIDVKDEVKIRFSKAKEIRKIKINSKVGNGEGVSSYSLSSAGMSLDKNIHDFGEEFYNPDDIIEKIENTNRKDRRNLMSKDSRVAEYVRSIALRRKIEKKKTIEDINTAAISTISTARPSKMRYTGLVPFIQQFPQKIMSLSVPKEKSLLRDGQIIVR